MEILQIRYDGTQETINKYFENDLKQLLAKYGFGSCSSGFYVPIKKREMLFFKETNDTVDTVSV